MRGLTLPLLLGAALGLLAGWLLFRTDPIPCQTVVDNVADTADANRVALTDVRARLDACTAREQQAQQSSEAALRDALARRSEIERELDRWRGQWQRVSSDCTQALINMEHACTADIESY